MEKRAGKIWNIYFKIILFIIFIFLSLYLVFIFSKNFDLNISYSNGSLGSQNVFVKVNVVASNPPQIISYFPLNLTPEYSGTDILYFNISKFDPDGTVPDSYWYVDETFKAFFNGSSEDYFSYIFGCGVSGVHVVKVVVTDGKFNVSMNWSILLSYVSCTFTPGGGGGGGGGGTSSCKEKWTCDDWKECQNLNDNYNSSMADEDYSLLKEKCRLLNYDENICGFQQRGCEDVNHCGTFKNLPNLFQECYYTFNPNCFDNIKNCHNGSCETSVDCGGSCEACATCFDNIKNQNEEMIDCGGVCKLCIEEPLKIYIWIYVLIILIFWLLLIIWFLKRKIKLILILDGGKTKKIGYVTRRFLKNLKIGSVFSFNGRRYRLVKRLLVTAYVRGARL